MNQVLAATELYLLGHSQEAAPPAASPESTLGLPRPATAKWMCSNRQASHCTGTTAEVTIEQVSASGRCLPWKCRNTRNVPLSQPPFQMSCDFICMAKPEAHAEL